MCLFGFDYGTRAIIGLTEGAVFPQEIMPGPVILANTVAADSSQTDLGQTVAENNSQRLFWLPFKCPDGWGLPH